MKNIRTHFSMDINAAVNYAADQIHLGAIGFFVDAEFGRIPVEVFKRRSGGTNESYTTTWDAAPYTEWVIRNRNGGYKYYVSINYVPGQKMLLTKMQLIREFTAVMFMSLTGHKIIRDDAGLLVDAYLESYEEYSSEMTTENYISEYIRVNTGLGKIVPSVRKMMELEVRRSLRAEESTKKLRQAQFLSDINKRKFIDTEFGNDFYTMLFAVTYQMACYCDHDELLKLLDGDGNIGAYELLQKMNRK